MEHHLDASCHRKMFVFQRPHGIHLHFEKKESICQIYELSDKQPDPFSAISRDASDGSSGVTFDDSTYEVEPTPAPVIKLDTPSPVEAPTAFDTPAPAISSAMTPAPAISFPVTPAPEIPPSPVDPTDDDADGECTNPAGAYQQVGNKSLVGLLILVGRRRNGDVFMSVHASCWQPQMPWGYEEL